MRHASVRKGYWCVWYLQRFCRSSVQRSTIFMIDIPYLAFLGIVIVSTYDLHAIFRLDVLFLIYIKLPFYIRLCYIVTQIYKIYRAEFECLSCALGTSRCRTTNHSGVVAVTPSRPWSIPIIPWTNNFYQTYLRQNTFKIITKSSDVDDLPPLWRHASLLNGGSCSFVHPVVKGRSERGTSWGILKMCGQFMQEGLFIAIKIIYLESSITRNIYDIVFGSISRRFKLNHNETYRRWRQHGGWYALSIVTHARSCSFTHRAVKGNH